MLTSVRLILMHQGRTEHDFELNMEKPIKGEIISMANPDGTQNDYDIEFIQHWFNEYGTYKYVLVTGIRKYGK
jgi:hypothetical protein